MKAPPHPERSIKDACLAPLDLTVTEGANVLGVTRATLSNPINGRAGISPEMAIRLAKASGRSPEADLARALKNEAALDAFLPGSLSPRRSRRTSALDESARIAFFDDIRRRLLPYMDDAGLVLPFEAHSVLASR